MLLRCEGLEPPVSQMGLGRVKTSALVLRVARLIAIAHHESEFMLHAQRLVKRVGEMYFLHFAYV